MSFLCFGCVPQGSVKIVEQLGRFQRVARPGFHLLMWPFQYFAGDISLRVTQADIRVSSKTLDDVFVETHVAVQYSVAPSEDSAYNAFYRLSNPVQQLTAYVCDTVRSTVPRLTLADVFVKKEVIAEAVRDELTKQIGSWGFTLVSALVTDITPEPQVRQAMNEIQAQQRLRLAAKEKAEANKILTVTAAAAAADAAQLRGEGLARERRAVVEGLRDSIVSFGDAVDGVSSKDVVSLMLTNQWLEMMSNVGSNAKSSAVFLPSAPGEFHALRSQFIQGVLAPQGMSRE